MGQANQGLQQCAGHRVGVRRIAGQPEGVGDQMALPDPALGNESGGLVRPADDGAGMNGAAKLPGAEPGQDMVRDDAVKGQVDQRATGDIGKDASTPDPGKACDPVTAPHGAMAGMQHHVGQLQFGPAGKAGNVVKYGHEGRFAARRVGADLLFGFRTFAQKQQIFSP